MYCFYAWFKKGGFETIKLFSYNSLCRCFKAHTILKSIRICLCFEGCGGDAFPHIAKTSPSSGCFLKRDFGGSSLLKLRNFKTSIRICLCLEGSGGDSFHQIAKKIPVKRVLLQAGLRRMGPHDAEKVQKISRNRLCFLLKKLKQRARNYKIKFPTKSL